MPSVAANSTPTATLGCSSRDNPITVAALARIISIDYGKKRTGLAVTDPMQLIANGLTTVDTKSLFEYLSDYVAHEDVERIVIGKPTQMNAQPSENMARIENFVGRWRNAHPEIPIEYYDERFTSVLAHRATPGGRSEEEGAQGE